MNVERKLKLWEWMTIVLIIVILSGVICWRIRNREKEKLEFCQEFLGWRSRLFLKYCEKYKNDWLEQLALIRTESDFKRGLLGEKREFGWYQVLPSTQAGMISLVKRIAENPNDKYEINLISGNLHYAAMRRWCKDNLSTVECYNMGLGRIRVNQKNSPYVERYLISLEWIEREWEEFRSWL